MKSIGQQAIRVVASSPCEKPIPANPGTFWCAGRWPRYKIPWCFPCICKDQMVSPGLEPKEDK